MNADNPITQRLEILQDQYAEFCTTPGAVVFRWLFERDEEPMLQAFVDTENEDRGCTNDLFLRLHDGFANAEVHGFRLAKSLEQLFERPPETKEGDPPAPSAWKCPVRTAEDKANPYFLKCLKSFCDHFQEDLELAVLILSPSSISVFKVYVDWLAQLAKSPLPPQIRILLADHPSHPAYAELDTLAPGKVFVKSANLDMEGAIAEIAEEDESPRGLYRKHYALMTLAVGKSDLAKGEIHGKEALGVTASEDLPQLEPAIHLTLAAGYLGLKHHQEALDKYCLSEASSRKAIEKKEPEGPKLLVQSLLGKGGALVFLKRWEDAAQAYQEAAGLATPDDLPTALEAHRMA
ncbi:MAG TPA: hypothetical protein PKY05_19695, partial [Fibrobacteria bacterium]|nr:hypothetical protein [Fibrobacteria bacterium]